MSIGALSRNRMWNETEPRRAGHATTTLVRDGKATILVDPGLPAEVLAQRLEERTGLRPEQIDTVFLTNFRPVHRRALSLFSSATWLMHEPEIEAMRAHLEEIDQRVAASEDDVKRLVRDELALLSRIQAAPDKLTPSVHLFPTAGVTPGAAGLLLASPTYTIMIAGDAIISRGYYEAGRIFDQVASVDEAQESFKEIIEIADEIVPGHDNVFRVVGR
ncbi:MAG TPA: MBL fold metallo-hydrolase [Phycisphaerae bacterium]|nr:MBL fold metallo-hydrolase [Phycisphaerae bacterium]HOB76504.1 MBL fold metallo-hydrolase [Phycisphaerae bacterium]HOJ56058.1 MBL fold metallo-hydrolase [Phycisphaerae bacterium]HOL28312.1 MBL fold metallo-hydrolase [Phycisphaerae bacterium]HPP22786.1 MBL fold metallo-hydrolase [Phycisphaerae bacterium]